MKITAILNVNSVKGSRKITFDALTDGSANENVSTSLEGQPFSTKVNGTAPSISGSIAHSKSGQHTVTVHADTSDVDSDPVLLDL